MRESASATNPERPPSLTRTGLALALTSIGFGLAAMLLVVAGARWLLATPLSGPPADVGRARAWFTERGLLSVEKPDEASPPFTWAQPLTRLIVPNLDRSQGYQLVMVLSARRPEGVAVPTVRVLVDGALAAETLLTNVEQQVVATIPGRDRPGASIRIDSSEVWIPGAGDQRRLGMVIHSVSLLPETGHFRPTPSVLFRTFAAIAALVAGLFLARVRRTPLAIAATAVTVVFSMLLVRDGAFMGTLVSRLLGIAMAVAVLGGLLALAHWRWPRRVPLDDWSAAIGITLAAAAAKLALFAHPLAPVVDAIFQVHRAEEVLAGRYFFTSVTPSPYYEFPYAPALYVVAVPFWSVFTTELDHAWLMRGLVIVADALIGLALYAVARRQWADKRPALIAAALWPFAWVPFQALRTANLTNAFGEALFGLAMLGVALTALHGVPVLAGTFLVGTLLTLAVLSHFGTLTIGLPLACLVSLLLIVGGDRVARRVGVLALAATLAAATIAYVVYYSHFNALYGQTFARIVSGEGRSAANPIAAPALDKVQRLWRLLSRDGFLSLCALTAACVGSWVLIRQRRREPFTLVLAGWVLAWLCFTILGILTPLQMRTDLAAAPALFALSAYGLFVCAERSRLGAGIATMLAAGIIWSGARLWIGVLS